MNVSKLPATMLMVDDDASMVRLVTRIIERSFQGRIQVESLTDPTAALARIERGGVSILLTDLDMPEIGGLDLLRSAKQRNASTQVLFLTGQSHHGALLEALELGASDYILKPLDKPVLVELVGQSLERHYRWQKAILAGATSCGKGARGSAALAGDASDDTSWNAIMGKVKNTLSLGFAAVNRGTDS